MNSDTQAELPRYKCHKEVRALKIEKISNFADVFTLHGESYRVAVNRGYVEKHQPEVGGYYVRYQDGYESFSPAKAFEDGYTRVDV